MPLKNITFQENVFKNDENKKKLCNFHKKLFPFKRLFCKKSFQNPLVLCSKLFGKLKKFPYKGLFPFDGFACNEDELYKIVYT